MPSAMKKKIALFNGVNVRYRHHWHVYWSDKKSSATRKRQNRTSIKTDDKLVDVNEPEGLLRSHPQPHTHTNTNIRESELAHAYACHRMPNRLATFIEYHTRVSLVCTMVMIFMLFPFKLHISTSRKPNDMS